MPNSESKEDVIRIVGAREHNLRNLTFDLPKHQLVALAGVSGAGKSTIAHHLIAKIARRRLGRLRGEDWALSPAYEPSVDTIEGLPACIEIIQEPLRGQVRSTVATYTGLSYLLAGLYLHHSISKSLGGAIIETPSNELLISWLMNFHRGKNVLLAQIRPDVPISSKNQLPKDEFFYRERRSQWSASSTKPAKQLVPGRWWIAEPSLTLRLQSEADAHRLLLQYSTNSLLVIDRRIYLEHSWHRLAEDEPIPFDALTRSLFSFNISAAGGGQCSTCSGLGIIQGVKEDELIACPTVPLLEGGLGLPQSKGKFSHLGVLDDILRGVFHTFALPLNISWNNLPHDVRNIILYGSDRTLIPELRANESKVRTAKRSFPGIIPLIMSRARSAGAAAKIFEAWVGETVCPDCTGSRFNYTTRACIWRGLNWGDVVSGMSIGELCKRFEAATGAASGREADLLKGIFTLLNTYNSLNLGHLSLARATSTLSGGEAQRLKLGLGLALELCGAAFIVDEPSRGLHPQDVIGLSEMLKKVVESGNTVILVEHQKDLLSAADHVLTLGPGGGALGGQIVKTGRPIPQESRPHSSATLPAGQSTPKWVKVSQVNLHNLRDVSFRFPTGRVTTVVGVSGAGKSSAILGAMMPAVANLLEGGTRSPLCKVQMPAAAITFVDLVGQRLAGQNRKSTVATVLEIFDKIRDHYASQAAAKALGLTAADFSFNSAGACPECEGSGYAKDGFGKETKSRCHACDGSRFASPALLVESRNFNIAQLLCMPIGILSSAAHPAFDEIAIQKLTILVTLGLGHLSLGRATSTLSMGERQRLALARFLSRVEQHSGPGLLVLDEPTAGLSLHDAYNVFERIRGLAYEHGHTVVVLEHKLEMLSSADWLLEFGPAGGPSGGRLVFEGIPSDLKSQKTATAAALSSSRAISDLGSKIRRDKPKNSQWTEASVISWSACADVFEPLATHLDVRDEMELILPLRPAVRLNPGRMPEDFRVGDFLELSKWVRSKGCSNVRCDVKAFTSDEELAEAVIGNDFLFSPLSGFLRLGLAVIADVLPSVRRLEGLGFSRAVLNGSHIPLKEVPKLVKRTEQLTQLFVLCPALASAVQRKLALRLSEGTIHISTGGSFSTLSTQFLGEGGDIGLPLRSPFVGDYHSPQGRCMQCLGSGRLRAYAWKLIVADETRSFKDDAFWHSSLLPAIRGLRRSRLLPEATFFAKQGVADFLQPPSTMNAGVRLNFEYGIPSRRFLKPSAIRKDREQDYFSWRGLHDYVHQCLGGMVDSNHKSQLRNNIIETLCPKCKGSGMGWEAYWFKINGITLNEAWMNLSLLNWHEDLGCKEAAIIAAIELGLETLRPNTRWRELPAETHNALLLAMSHTSPLDGLSLLTNSTSKVSKRISKFFASHKMQLRACP